MHTSAQSRFARMYYYYNPQTSLSLCLAPLPDVAMWPVVGRFEHPWLHGECFLTTRQPLELHRPPFARVFLQFLTTFVWSVLGRKLDERKKPSHALREFDKA